MQSHWPRRVALSAGAIVSATGAAVLVAWSVHFTPLIQIAPRLAPTHHTTAFSFLLSGVATILFVNGRTRAAAICAVVPLVLATSALLQDATGADFGIDQLLGPEYIAVETTNPGRMSPVSALAFIVFALCLMLMSRFKLGERTMAAIVALGSAMIALGMVCILDYLWGWADPYGWGHITRISLDSAACFGLLGLALLALVKLQRPHEKGLSEWVSVGVGLGLAIAVLGIWQALMQHKGSDIRLLSITILAGGLMMAALVAVLLHLAQQARRRSQALRHSEERFRRVFEEGPSGMALLEKDGQIAMANSALCRMLAYSESELRGMSFQELTHSGDPGVDRALTERLFDDQIQLYETTKRYVKKTGEVLWASVTASTIHDAEGKPLYGLAMVEDVTEQRRADAELDLGNAIIANMEEGVCLVRLNDAVIVRTNPKFEKMFGYEPGELFGKNIGVINAPTDKSPEDIAEDIRRKVESEGIWRGEVLHRRKNDTTLWCAVTGSAFYHAELGWVGTSIHRDITASRQAEQQLRDQAALLDLAHDAIIVRDLNYKITFWNRGATEMYGWGAEQAEGRDIRDIIPTKFPTCCANIEAILQQQEGWEGELQHTTRDGRTLVMDSRWSLLRDEQRKPWAIMQINRDITARKTSEEQLRNLSDRLSLATRSASIGIWDWDLRTDLGTWDETMFEIFGLPRRGSVSYLDWARRVHPDDLRKTEALLQNAIRAQTPYAVDFRIIRSDGFLRHITAAAGVFADEGGKPVRVVGTAMDITERKRLEAEIEAGKEQMVASARLSALGMMAGGIAHEINNPLSIIHALASDLVELVEEEGVAPASMVLRNSRRIRETADRIAKIVKSLRQISREGSRDRLYAVPIGKILEETLDICRERFRAYSVNLQVPNVDPKLRVACREVQIEQVLLNLLQNAFDAVVDLPGERSVRLEVTCHDDLVVIAVSDNGPGIPPELRSRIMEPFFTTKAVGKGTGLGLSLSKTIAEEHGGQLVYGQEHSRTYFSLVLPLARQPEAVWN